MEPTISPTSRSDRTRDLYPDLDPGPPTPPATRVAVPQPAIPELPDVDDALVASAVRAATSGAPHPLLAMGVKGADVEYTTRDTPIQQRLDAFKASATPTFHTKDGEVRVAIPFRMVPTAEFMRQTDAVFRPFIQQEHKAQANAGELEVVARSLGLSASEVADLASGRGTPDNIRRVAQALIDRGRLPSGPPAETGARIRTMMCDYGVGLDCAGYVQQAFLASRGISRVQTALRPVADEDLKGLASRGFSRVPLSDVRAGDIFILKPPPGEAVGHTIIVRDARMADTAEANALSERNRAWGHPDASTIQRFEFDSSWGSWGDPQLGGVQREIFWHDTASGQWMHVSPRGWKVEPADAPYLGHPIDGAYRPASER